MRLPHHCQRRPISTLLTSISTSSSNWSNLHLFQSHPIFLTKPISKSHPFSCSLVISPARVVKTSVNLDNNHEEEEEETLSLSEWNGLKQKIEAVGINCGVYTPGQYTYLFCPKCKGGQSMTRSLSFYVNQNVDLAMWRCFHLECGWAGQCRSLQASGLLTGAPKKKKKKKKKGTNKISEVGLPRHMTEENLRLEPPGDEVVAYFADRMISKEVLHRNGVMQTVNDEITIAFPYRRHGRLVNCKYRTIISRKFWQKKGADRILYGLDGIKDSDEIIIVEGETDKLSMEEAGIFNSVSVPDGAPQKVSEYALPSIEQDTKFKYLWNCKEYLDKASRIVLATDSDIPGQALAEELARRLGRERCWIVTWPKKNELECFKDANDVLKNLGPGALRDIIENAQPYGMQNSN